jgi:glycosyltransferase involved in cell wall biosynthesis
MPFIVAFNGNRDQYQVPLALHERGMLRYLVTDLYAADNTAWRHVPALKRLGHRRADGLPSEQVVWTPRALMSRGLAKLRKVPPHIAFETVDDYISRKALHLAQSTGSDLFLYSNYAYHAFTHAPAGMHKGLFVYHPHIGLNRDLLLADYENHPECAWSAEHETDLSASGTRQERMRTEFTYADFIVCASAFTARSLEHQGCPRERINIIPYGIDTATVPFAPEAKRSDKVQLLFVGQGVQRKGLHHLFRAWSKVAPKDAELVVVASTMDPGIQALAGEGIRFLGRQSRDQLWHLFNQSHAFVLPSIIEGFGLVLLEALAAGCYCLTTSNTGFPDLNAPDWAGDVVPVGDIDALADALAEVIRRQREGELDPRQINGFAAQLTWSQFRERISRLIEEKTGMAAAAA